MTDQPTRRLPEPDTPAAPPLHHDPLADYHVPVAATQPLDTAVGDRYARPCLRCQAALRPASVRPEGPALLSNKGATLRLIAGRQSTSCSAWVCPACGYTELVADDPLTLFQS